MDKALTANGFESMMQQATALVQSGFLPKTVDTPQKAFAIITLGQELGLGAWAALNGIDVIQGKPTISPQLMLGLIYRSGQLENLTIDDPKTISENNACGVTMQRKGQEPHTEIFTIAMAQAMELAGRANWRKQPATMLKWRAVSACARIVFPDVLVGLYGHEEINPDLIVDVSGEVVNGPPVALPAQTPDATTEKVIGNPGKAAPAKTNGTSKPAAKKTSKPKAGQDKAPANVEELVKVALERFGFNHKTHLDNHLKKHLGGGLDSNSVADIWTHLLAVEKKDAAKERTG